MNLKSNLIYNVVYQISTIIIPLVTAPYISRVLGSEGVGVYGYTTSVATYFALFMLLGVSNYGSRTIAKNRNNKNKCSRIFCEIYSMQLLCSVIVIIGYIFFLLFIADNNKVALSLQVLYLVSVMLDVIWYFNGTEQFKVTVTRGVIIRFLEVLFILLFVRQKEDTNKYILIMVMGTLVSQACLWPNLLKQVKIERPEIQNVGKHFGPSLILFIPILATSVFNIMDKIMIQAICQNYSAIGIYESSEKIVKLPLGIILAIGTVMLPRISNMLANNKEDESSRYFDLTMKYLGLLVIAMSLGIAAIAPIFSVVFYGEEFRECGNIITTLSVILISASWANVIRTQYLIPASKEKIYTIAVIAGAIVNLALNFLFIPRYGAFGAAIGTVGAELTLSVIHTVGVWKIKTMTQYVVGWSQYVAIGLVMFAVVRFINPLLPETLLSLLMEICIGGVIYVVLSILLLLLKKDVIIKKLLRIK